MKTRIINARLINEGQAIAQDLLLDGQRIIKIAPAITDADAQVIDAKGAYLLPGIIDDQVHFREPGLTHKATIYTEAKAAVAGGVTSFMEMPNTQPTTTTQVALAEKYALAAATSLANYSFYMGATNDNLEEVLRTDGSHVCGIKVFMGSSTGNMLVDNTETLAKLFSECPLLIATHCEDEATVRQRMAHFQAFADPMTAALHPVIRNEEACYLSSSKAVALAKQYGTRLHILHLTTAQELALFDNKIPLPEKKITAEVCVHHLHFTADDYARLGNLIQCNPAIKAPHHKAALWKALLDNTLDVIATDHAPHTWAEKAKPYPQSPSGLPLVQHSLLLLYQYVLQGQLTLPEMVEKMCHNVATCFRIPERGYIKEGYYADLVLFNPEAATIVDKAQLLYKCGWSPLEGSTLQGRVEKVWVSGHLAYADGNFDERQKGMRLQFQCP